MESSASDGDPESRTGGRTGGRTGRRWVWAGGAVLGAALLVLASVAAGLKMDSRETVEPRHGRWYWIVSDGTGYTVKTKAEDRCGVPVYVGCDLVRVEGFIVPVGVRRRVWVLDPNRDLEDAGYRAAVVRQMRTQPEMTAWAACLDAPRRTIAERSWIGTTVFGASVVVPGVGLAGLGAMLGTHAWRQALARRAQRRTLCAACGYSLNGLDAEETAVCPECGTHRSARAKPRTGQLLPTG